MSKNLSFDDSARQAIAAGVSKLARAVKCTLGPRGRNAVLDKGWGAPKVTKDGVTVAEDITLDDPEENLGAQLVKDAILEACADAQVLDFTAVNQIGTDCGLTLMYLCLSEAHAQHHQAY